MCSCGGKHLISEIRSRKIHSTIGLNLVSGFPLQRNAVGRTLFYHIIRRPYYQEDLRNPSPETPPGPWVGGLGGAPGVFLPYSLMLFPALQQRKGYTTVEEKINKASLRLFVTLSLPWKD